MSASSAPTAKANLLTLLRADPGATGVQISYAHPGPAVSQEDVFFHGTRETETAIVLGQQRRDEDYTIDLVVTVSLDGDDPQACEERMWAIVGVVENVVRANPTLNGAVNKWAVYIGAEQTPYMEAGQRVSEAVCHINCKHRK